MIVLGNTGLQQVNQENKLRLHSVKPKSKNLKGTNLVSSLSILYQLYFTFGSWWFVKPRRWPLLCNSKLKHGQKFCHGSTISAFPCFYLTKFLRCHWFYFLWKTTFIFERFTSPSPDARIWQFKTCYIAAVASTSITIKSNRIGFVVLSAKALGFSLSYIMTREMVLFQL
jgi:hypothetical protein